MNKIWVLFEDKRDGSSDFWLFSSKRKAEEFQEKYNLYDKDGAFRTIFLRETDPTEK